MRRYSNFEIPEKKDGFLYYVRLKTTYGPIYKIGFTTWSSVSERIAYKRTGDEKLIDDVLMFVYLDGAYYVEQILHQHFKSKRLFGTYANAPDMPLAGNGQSELYAEDVLKLDDNFEPSQAESTKFNIDVKKAYRNSLNMGSARYKVRLERAIFSAGTGIAFFLKCIFSPKKSLRKYYAKDIEDIDDDYIPLISEEEYKNMKNMPVERILKSMYQWSDGQYYERLKYKLKVKEMAKILKEIENT